MTTLLLANKCTPHQLSLYQNSITYRQIIDKCVERYQWEIPRKVPGICNIHFQEPCMYDISQVLQHTLLVPYMKPELLAAFTWKNTTEYLIQKVIAPDEEQRNTRWINESYISDDEDTDDSLACMEMLLEPNYQQQLEETQQLEFIQTYGPFKYEYLSWNAALNKSYQNIYSYPDEIYQRVLRESILTFRRIPITELAKFLWNPALKEHPFFIGLRKAYRLDITALLSKYLLEEETYHFIQLLVLPQEADLWRDPKAKNHQLQQQIEQLKKENATLTNINKQLQADNTLLGQLKKPETLPKRETVYAAILAYNLLMAILQAQGKGRETLRNIKQIEFDDLIAYLCRAPYGTIKKFFPNCKNGAWGERYTQSDEEIKQALKTLQEKLRKCGINLELKLPTQLWNTLPDHTPKRR